MASKRRVLASLGRSIAPIRCCSQAAGPLRTAPALRRAIATPSKTPSTALSSRAELTIRPPQARRYASSAVVDEQDLRKTPLYEFHVAHGARMVPFGGYLMPLQYADQGIVESHLWTREKASLFDVSHMVQYHISGPGAAAFLSTITPSSVATLEDNHSTLSCLLNPGTGGIIDDTMITKLKADLFYVVTNAGCREKDYEYLTSQLKEFNAATENKAELELLDKKGLLALQGPLAASILESVLLDADSAKLNELYFGQCRVIRLMDCAQDMTYEVLASRGGYTGEDGFELRVQCSELGSVAELLLASAGADKLRLAGLAARDSLRLEAGLCLYGNDIDETTTPVEAGLNWIIGKDRRQAGGFHGASVILSQLKPAKEGGKGPSQRRVGLVVEGPPARQGAQVVNKDGEPVGVVTSGCPSPSLQKNIAMAYVKNGLHKAGTELEVLVRSKPRKATVTKMPFLPSKYYKGDKSSA